MSWRDECIGFLYETWNDHLKYRLSWCLYPDGHICWASDKKALLMSLDVILNWWAGSWPQWGIWMWQARERCTFTWRLTSTVFPFLMRTVSVLAFRALVVYLFVVNTTVSEICWLVMNWKEDFPRPAAWVRSP